MKIPERFIWAAGLMNIKKNDHILEIGCGAGLLAEEIARRLESGKITAVDKSIPMIEKAKKRNKEFIDKKISEFLSGDFKTLKFKADSYNSIAAFNVNFFWKSSVKEFKMIREILKNNGKLYIFYQTPYEIQLSAADPVKEKLLENSFRIIDTKLKKLSPTSAFCVIAKPTGEQK
jgi:ubiquinone/menaquinone biosynthesis C-methylase UbiE